MTHGTMRLMEPGDMELLVWRRRVPQGRMWAVVGLGVTVTGSGVHWLLYPCSCILLFVFTPCPDALMCAHGLLCLLTANESAAGTQGPERRRQDEDHHREVLGV